MEAYYETNTIIVKDFDPKEKKYIDVKQFVINLFDSDGDKTTYRFQEKEENKFNQTIDYFKKLIKNGDI